ncbi:MAG: sulfotransferase family 2 domain-containing protein [Pseudomonadota bacterium]
MVIRVDPHKLAYMAVPKAACSSVKATLATIDAGLAAENAHGFGQKQVHGLYPTQRFRMHRWDRLQEYFRFTVVRDPLTRLLAVYSNRVVGLRELHNCRKIKRGQVSLPADPDPDFFFQNLSAYASISSAIKHHALPTVVFTGSDLTRYSRVYRTSDIPELAQDLSAIIARDVIVPHFNSSDTPLSLSDLKPDTLSALRTRLCHEYAHLEDYFENPFGRRLFSMAA